MRRRHVTTISAMAVVALATLQGSIPVHAESAGAGEATVTLEVSSSTPGSLAAAAAVTLGNGGQVLGDAPSTLLVEIPERARRRLVEVVDGEVRTPVSVDVRPFADRAVAPVEGFGPTRGSQVEITNASAWHAAGIDGTDVKIGVIDFFDITKFWDTSEHGAVPVAGVTTRCFDSGRDCTADLYDGIDLGGEGHGIAVVEVIRDMAPGAQIFVGQANTLSDYRDLIDWFASNGVEVVNRSLGSRFDGPGDGRGPLDEIAAEAVARGMLWVNSGGNNGSGHYYRHLVRLSGDQVAFGPSGDTRFLPFVGCVSLGGVRWANDWDTPAPQRTDYDVYLWDSPMGSPESGSIVDRSERSQRSGADPIELLTESRCPSPGSKLYLEVRWRSGETSGDVLEILDYGAGIAQFTQAAYSAAVSIVDSHERGVIAVGAIDPPDGAVIAAYSSRGPNNDGSLAPDIVAPSGFYNQVYLGNFSGSSASAPVIAGAAALLLDAGLAANPNSLGDLIRNLAVDRGRPGPDDVYGHGEFRLPASPPVGGIDATPSRFVALDIPRRFLDTRPGSAVGPAALIGETWSGQVLELPVRGVKGVPTDDVTAVVANLVTVDPDRPGYLQSLPTFPAALGGYSNVNADAAGQTRANLAIVPVGIDGTISVYSVAEGHVIVDVLGWFEATSGPVAGGRFVELEVPQRVLDTRRDAPIGPISSNAIRSVPSPVGIAPDDIGSLVVTITSTEATAPGWVQAFPAARPDVVARTSTVNVATGITVANTTIVPADVGGIAITGRFAGGGSSHVVVDVIGYFTSPSSAPAMAGRYVPVQPSRAFDSRLTGGPLTDGQRVTVDTDAAPDSQVPNGATGVVWNVAIVDAARPGYLRAWAARRTEPSTSSLNWTLRGEIRAGASITPVDDGRARFRIEDGSANQPGPVGDLIVDVFGYFS